jgi:hypothetical protein
MESPYFLTTLNLVCGNFLYVIFLVSVQKTLCLVLAPSRWPLKNFSRKKIFLFLRLTNLFRRPQLTVSPGPFGAYALTTGPFGAYALTTGTFGAFTIPPSSFGAYAGFNLCSEGAIPTVLSAAIAGMVWSYNG